MNEAFERLVRLANILDQEGLYKEANRIDKVIKIALDGPDSALGERAAEDELRSILELVVKEIKLMQDVNKAKQIVLEHVMDSEISLKDKERIIRETRKQKDMVGLQKYLYNAILKYEGYGVINVSKSSSQIDKTVQGQLVDVVSEEEVPPAETSGKELISVLELVVKEIQLMQGTEKDPYKQLEQGKQIALNHVMQSKIDLKDKEEIINKVKKQENILKLMIYLYNLILFYKGFGVIDVSKSPAFARLLSLADVLESKGAIEEANELRKVAQIDKEKMTRLINLLRVYEPTMFRKFEKGLLSLRGLMPLLPELEKREEEHGEAVGLISMEKLFPSQFQKPYEKHPGGSLRPERVRETHGPVTEFSV